MYGIEFADATNYKFAWVGGMMWMYVIWMWILVMRHIFTSVI